MRAVARIASSRRDSIPRFLFTGRWMQQHSVGRDRAHGSTIAASSVLMCAFGRSAPAWMSNREERRNASGSGAPETAPAGQYDAR